MKYIVAVLAAVSCQQSASQKYDSLSLKVSSIKVLENKVMKCAGLLISKEMAVTLAECVGSDASKVKAVEHAKRDSKFVNLAKDRHHNTEYGVNQITKDPEWKGKAHNVAFLEIKANQTEALTVDIPTADDYKQEAKMVMLRYRTTTAVRNTRHEVEPIEYKLVNKEGCLKEFKRELQSDEYCLESLAPSKIRNTELGSPIFFALSKDTPKVAGIINDYRETKNSNGSHHHPKYLSLLY
ncbi:hypothetical protein DSO57_1024768 [Entomophthora muscae]|uniref:Uncharacterized protein n=1 Tax=Entomophthora muscae TaxID=34485 RepID=A0ACC2RTG7_9FUNG|nr:hypothetical protein DSO57_1024768 [Entomophthora muscae]